MYINKKISSSNGFAAQDRMHHLDIGKNLWPLCKVMVFI